MHGKHKNTEATLKKKQDQSQKHETQKGKGRLQEKHIDSYELSVLDT